jgi:hypothetical protein
MGYGPAQVVEAQPRVGLPFGLFSVLALRESGDPHWANGVTWEAVSCDPVTGFEDWQVDPNCETPMTKVFRGSGGVGEALPFTAVGSYRCGAPGGPAYQQGEEFAIADLLAHEQVQVEAFLWSRLALEATDVHPSGALDPYQALAALEQWMGEAYGSLGVIHGGRGSVSLLGKRVESSGSRLLTKIGTPVVAGGGYPGSSPAGAAAATGEAWLFASPLLFGYQGPVFTNAQLDRTKNDHYALAERQYVVGFDPCGVGAVRMNID